jgi:hypothetical protein
MPSNTLSLYCGRSFSYEQEMELKDRLRNVGHALSHGRNTLGRGSYGKTLGRPAGVSLGESMLSIMRGQPDAMAALFAHQPEQLVETIKFFFSDPTLRAAIATGISKAGIDPAVFATQELLNIPAEIKPRNAIDPSLITEEMLDELLEREQTADIRLRTLFPESK